MGGDGQPTDGVEPPFTIRVLRSGGFAGIRREWTIEVTGLDEAHRWVPLIEACPWQDTGGEGYPDGYIYDFRAADLAAVVPENRLDGPWRQLAEEVQRIAEAS